VLVGTGLGVYGVVFYGVSRWHARDDRLRRVAESRWRLQRKRRFDRLLRAGEISPHEGELSKEEYIDSSSRRDRRVLNSAFPPFIALWLGICIFTVIHGLVSS